CSTTSCSTRVVMTATVIIAVTMLAVWLYLTSVLKAKSATFAFNGSALFSFDIQGAKWTFLHFYDRYSVLLQQVMWLTAAAMVAAGYFHCVTGFYFLLAALIDNILLRALMLYWYEMYSH